MAEPFIYIGQIVHSLSSKDLQFIENGVIVVNNGKVAEIEQDAVNLSKLKNEYKVPNDRIYQLKSTQFLIPGLIDTHIHGSQYPNAGLGTDMPLLDWLNTYTFQLESKFSDSDFAQEVYSAVVKQTLSSGTTTACYFATIHANSALLLAKEAVNRNQRAFVGKVNMNTNSPDYYVESLQETLDQTEVFLNSMKNMGIVRPIITPRFAISCDMELMQSLAKLATKYDVHIQSHISENADEVSFVSTLFPDCTNYASVYEKAGLLTSKTILAHGVLLTDDEIKLLRERGTSISHCPNSNITLQSGLCPVRRLLSAGLKVGLGTDCSGGYSTSMLDSIRCALQTSVCVAFSTSSSSRLTIPEVFFMATVGGAQALSIDSETGNFTKGKEFDAIVVDITTNPCIDLLQPLTLNELFQKFIYLGDDRNIYKVYVAGRLSIDKSKN